MTSPRRPTNMENLPDEVLSVIFIRLLAKQLARMRCVCKSWNTLLSGSSFVKFHLHHLIHTNHGILLFFGTIPPSFNCGLVIAGPSHSPDLELTNFMKIPFNTQSNDTNYGNVIGSVNGLICFSYGPFYDYSLHIWNPSLSPMLTLPPFFEPSIRNHLRFGYDPKTDDYKVVKLCFEPSYDTCNMVLQAEVYSMKKGSWDVIYQRFPSHITWICDRDEVCVDGHNGHLHWPCCTTYKTHTPRGRKPQTIVAFNLGAETFREIPLPDSVLNHTCCNLLGILGGKLCVMSSVEGGKCEVWVMDEYGVPQSWVKHHAFSQFHDITL